MTCVLVRMQVRMQLGYWGGIWGTTRPQNIMVSKMNTVSLATVEVGNPRLVWRFSGTGAPRPLPPPPVALLSLCICKGEAAHHYTTPAVWRKGKRKGEDDPGPPLQGKDPAVTHLISTHFPPARIPSRNHTLLQESWEMQSQACAGICPGASSLIAEKRGWMLKQKGSSHFLP